MTLEDDPHKIIDEFCDTHRAGEIFDLDRLCRALQLIGFGLPKMDPDHPDTDCARENCGHPYYRHFDPYEGDRMVGCKYCSCMEFVEPIQLELPFGE